MITEIKETTLEVLTGRIINGIQFCNTTWQQARAVSEQPAQYENLMNILDIGSKRLQGLISVAKVYGLNTCVFGQCKWNEDFFICFGCTKSEAQNEKH